MHPAPLPTFRLLLLLLLTFSGVTRAWAIVDEDPLKDLIDGLRTGRIESIETWLEVLSDQPRETTTTLALVLREDGNKLLMQSFEKQLREVCAYAALQHEQVSWEPNEWHQHSRLCMEIVTLLGDATEANHLINLLSVPRHRQERDYDVRSFMRPLKRSLLEACNRDALTLRVIQRAYGHQSRALDSQLLRILGSCDDPKTPDTLANCLGKKRHFDGIVLTQIASALRKPHLRLSIFGLGAVRPLLDSDVAHTRQSAARALGYADDTESIRALIQLLSDSTDSVRNESLVALHRITAMTIEGHPKRWLHWFEEETDWWIDVAPNTLRTLTDTSEKGVAHTLRELAGKRLFRREIAPHVMLLLEDPRPEVVRLALATLESLRPPLTELAPLLKRLTDHRSPIVRNDARRILRYLTTRTNSTLPASNIPPPH